MDAICSNHGCLHRVSVPRDDLPDERQHVPVLVHGFEPRPEAGRLLTEGARVQRERGLVGERAESKR